ncbi:MAG: hypothetical protein ACKPKO_47070 [Candidatus Fonsibacter sp.]
MLGEYQCLVQTIIDLDPYILKSTLTAVLLQLNQLQEHLTQGRLQDVGVQVDDALRQALILAQQMYRSLSLMQSNHCPALARAEAN